MAKIKRTLKENRVFLNAYDKGCTDVLFWRVEAYASYKDENKAQWSAELSLPQNTNMYATKKGELRPLTTVQREINKFNDAVDEAQAACEEHNGKS